MVLKNFSVMFMNIKVVKTVINEVNLVIFGEIGQIILSLKVSQNYFSQLYTHKFVQYVINGSRASL